MDSRAQEIGEICRQMAPLFAGRELALIGAALGNMVAAWLSAYQGPADGIDALREKLLQAHIKLVRNLMSHNEQMLREGLLQKRQ